MNTWLKAPTVQTKRITIELECHCPREMFDDKQFEPEHKRLREELELVGYWDLPCQFEFGAMDQYCMGCPYSRRVILSEVNKSGK